MQNVPDYVIQSLERIIESKKSVSIISRPTFPVLYTKRIPHSMIKKKIEKECINKRKQYK